MADHRYIIQVWNLEPVDDVDCGWITIDKFTGQLEDAQYKLIAHKKRLFNEYFRLIEFAQ